jgi:hypothetical protein
MEERHFSRKRPYDDNDAEDSKPAAVPTMAGAFTPSLFSSLFLRLGLSRIGAMPMYECTHSLLFSNSPQI